jgi:hypothetical protein
MEKFVWLVVWYNEDTTDGVVSLFVKECHLLTFTECLHCLYIYTSEICRKIYSEYFWDKSDRNYFTIFYEAIYLIFNYHVSVSKLLTYK